MTVYSPTGRNSGAADRESVRPGFAAAIFPGHLWMEDSGRAAAKRAFDARMTMRKIDIAGIETARRGR